MLLPGLVAADADHLLERLNAELARAATSEVVAVRASFGAHACEPYGEVTAAWAEADRRMYEDKRDHRSRA